MQGCVRGAGRVQPQHKNLVKKFDVIQEERTLEGWHTEGLVNQWDNKNLGQEYYLEDEFWLPRLYPE